MRKLSESFANPGNGIAQGLMNHYTPIDNIIINVRNIFGALLGLVVSKGEDGVSLKIQSSNFTDPDTTSNILYQSTFDGRTYLADYIIRQGLADLKIICLGNSCIAYFCPNNLADMNYTENCCKEMKESNLIECEMYGINENITYSEEELEDKTQEEIANIINETDKIKAAREFEEKLKQVMKLPDNMYIKATKDADGHESIALRYKSERRRPFGGKVDNIVSLLNIYSTGENAIWVDAYLNKDMLDQDVQNIIDSLLKFIGAEQTNDECVWNIGVGNKVKVEDEDDDNKEDNDEDDKIELNVEDENNDNK